MAGLNIQLKQYFRAVLPQGFKNSHTIFGESSAKDLKVLPLEKETLLQYADDILIASPTKETSELPSQ